MSALPLLPAGGSAAKALSELRAKAAAAAAVAAVLRVAVFMAFNPFICVRIGADGCAGVHEGSFAAAASAVTEKEIFKVP